MLVGKICFFDSYFKTQALLYDIWLSIIFPLWVVVMTSFNRKQMPPTPIRYLSKHAPSVQNNQRMTSYSALLSIFQNASIDLASCPVIVSIIFNNMRVSMEWLLDNPNPYKL